MAHTIVIGSSVEKKVIGRRADVVLAAHFASQAALRLLKPGTEVGLRILCASNCHPVVLSFLTSEENDLKSLKQILFTSTHVF